MATEIKDEALTPLAGPVHRHRTQTQTNFGEFARWKAVYEAHQKGRLTLDICSVVVDETVFVLVLVIAAGEC